MVCYAIAFGKRLQRSSITLMLNGFFLRWKQSKEYPSMLLSSEELAKDMVRISNSATHLFFSPGFYSDQRKVVMLCVFLDELSGVWHFDQILLHEGGDAA